MIATKIVPFRLDWEFQEGPATSARLRIRAGDEPVTLVARTPAAGGRQQIDDHVEVDLYPLAEWIAENWWSLVADARPGTMISQLRFAYKRGVGDQRAPWVQRSRRHVTRAAGDGYHWPDLLVVPEGRQTRLVWTPDPTATTGTRYLSTGNALVETAVLTERLADLVRAVIARLDAADRHGTSLHEAWHAVTTADEESAAFCRLTAQLGLDPYLDADAYQEDILHTAENLPQEMVFDFFNGVGRNRLRERLDWLNQARTTTGTAPAGQPLPEAILELREVCADLRELFHAPGGLEDPWDIGAETALRVRRHLGVADTEPFDPAPFMHYEVQPTPYFDRGLVAAGSLHGSRGPTLITARAFDDRPRRFLQCRALWHFVCGEEPDFLIVAAHTHRQHVARGFALEALAPATGIAALLGDPQHLVTAEDVEQIADDYLCGNIVVEHQLDNRVTGPHFAWHPDPSVLGALAVRAAPEGAAL